MTPADTIVITGDSGCAQKYKSMRGDTVGVGNLDSLNSEASH